MRYLVLAAIVLSLALPKPAKADTEGAVSGALIGAGIGLGAAIVLILLFNVAKKQQLEIDKMEKEKAKEANLPEGVNPLLANVRINTR